MLALALDGGPLLVSQSGLQAVFVVALPRTPGSGLARWEDALVGGVVALLVAFLLPQDPWRAARRGAERCLGELAAAARQRGRALRTPTPARPPTRCRGRAAPRPVSTRGPRAEHRPGHQPAVTAAPRPRGHLGRQARLHDGVDRAIRNLRVLVRRVLFASRPARCCRCGCRELDRFADAVDALADRRAPARGPPAALLTLAAELDPGALGTTGLSASVVVAQLRSAVVDLLVATGIETDRARSALPPLH